MAKGTLFLVANEVDSDVAEARARVMERFPAIFSMVILLLFVVPTCLIWIACMHPVVRYWHGDWHYALIIIPVLIIFVHNFHSRYGPNKYVTNLALIIPSLILLFFGSSMNGHSQGMTDSLFSIDCDILPGKAHLQREWEAAHALYDTCLNETAKGEQALKEKWPKSFLAEKFKITDCTEYDNVLEDHWHSWGYLSLLEQNYACTGFCTPGQQLWTKAVHKDSCAVTVAAVYKHLVHGNAVQVVAISILTLIVDVVALLFLAPILKANGVSF